VEFKRPRRALDYVIAVVLLVIPAAFLHANFKDPGKVNAVDRTVLRVSAPIQRGVSWVISGVSNAWGRYVWLVDVDEENAELRRENQELRRKLAGASSEMRQLEQYRSLAGVREATTAETVGARVIAVGLNPHHRISRIVLENGSGQVAAGMPVVAEGGVVGQIDRVYGGYADVKLAVDPAHVIDVMIEGSKGRGLLRGMGGENAYSCKIDYLLRSSEVHVDDRIVTSGLDGVFPPDLEVGKVKKIDDPGSGMYLDVEVRPSVDFSRLGAVLVILAPPPPPDPSAKGKKLPEAAFGVTPYK
jgi:rod shape-determining protein MreC